MSSGLPTRRSRTGSKSAIGFLLPFSDASQKRRRLRRFCEASLNHSSSQLGDESILLVRRHVQPILIVDEHTRCALAGADALGELQTDLVILGPAARHGVELLT